MPHPPPPTAAGNGTSATRDTPTQPQRPSTAAAVNQRRRTAPGNAAIYTHALQPSPPATARPRPSSAAVTSGQPHGGSMTDRSSVRGRVMNAEREEKHVHTSTSKTFDRSTLPLGAQAVLSLNELDCARESASMATRAGSSQQFPSQSSSTLASEVDRFRQTLAMLRARNWESTQRVLSHAERTQKMFHANQSKLSQVAREVSRELEGMEAEMDGRVISQNATNGARGDNEDSNNEDGSMSIQPSAESLAAARTSLARILRPLLRRHGTGGSVTSNKEESINVLLDAVAAWFLNRSQNASREEDQLRRRDRDLEFEQREVGLAVAAASNQEGSGSSGDGRDDEDSTSTSPGRRIGSGLFSHVVLPSELRQQLVSKFLASTSIEACRTQQALEGLSRSYQLAQEQLAAVQRERELLSTKNVGLERRIQRLELELAIERKAAKSSVSNPRNSGAASQAKSTSARGGITPTPTQTSAPQRSTSSQQQNHLVHSLAIERDVLSRSCQEKEKKIQMLLHTMRYQTKQIVELQQQQGQNQQRQRSKQQHPNQQSKPNKATKDKEDVVVGDLMANLDRFAAYHPHLLESSSSSNDHITPSHAVSSSSTGIAMVRPTFGGNNAAASVTSSNITTSTTSTNNSHDTLSQTLLRLHQLQVEFSSLRLTNARLVWRAGFEAFVSYRREFRHQMDELAEAFIRCMDARMMEDALHWASTRQKQHQHQHPHTNAEVTLSTSIATTGPCLRGDVLQRMLLTMLPSLLTSPSSRPSTAASTDTNQRATATDHLAGASSFSDSLSADVEAALRIMARGGEIHETEDNRANDSVSALSLDPIIEKHAIRALHRAIARCSQSSNLGRPTSPSSPRSPRSHRPSSVFAALHSPRFHTPSSSSSSSSSLRISVTSFICFMLRWNPTHRMREHARLVLRLHAIFEAVVGLGRNDESSTSSNSEKKKDGTNRSSSSPDARLMLTPTDFEVACQEIGLSVQKEEADAAFKHLVSLAMKTPNHEAPDATTSNAGMEGMQADTVASDRAVPSNSPPNPDQLSSSSNSMDFATFVRFFPISFLRSLFDAPPVHWSNNPVRNAMQMEQACPKGPPPKEPDMEESHQRPNAIQEQSQTSSAGASKPQLTRAQRAAKRRAAARAATNNTTTNNQPDPSTTSAAASQSLASMLASSAPRFPNGTYGVLQHLLSMGREQAPSASTTDSSVSTESTPTVSPALPSDCVQVDSLSHLLAVAEDKDVSPLPIVGDGTMLPSSPSTRAPHLHHVLERIASCLCSPNLSVMAILSQDEMEARMRSFHGSSGNFAINLENVSNNTSGNSPRPSLSLSTSSTSSTPRRSGSTPPHRHRVGQSLSISPRPPSSSSSHDRRPSHMRSPSASQKHARRPAASFSPPAQLASPSSTSSHPHPHPRPRSAQAQDASKDGASPASSRKSPRAKTLRQDSSLIQGSESTPPTSASTPGTRSSRRTHARSVSSIPFSSPTSITSATRNTDQSTETSSSTFQNDDATVDASDSTRPITAAAAVSPFARRHARSMSLSLPPASGIVKPADRVDTSAGNQDDNLDKVNEDVHKHDSHHEAQLFSSSSLLPISEHHDAQSRVNTHTAGLSNGIHEKEEDELSSDEELSSSSNEEEDDIGADAPTQNDDVKKVGNDADTHEPSDNIAVNTIAHPFSSITSSTGRHHQYPRPIFGASDVEEKQQSVVESLHSDPIASIATGHSHAQSWAPTNMDRLIAELAMKSNEVRTLREQLQQEQTRSIQLQTQLNSTHRCGGLHVCSHAAVLNKRPASGMRRATSPHAPNRSSSPPRDVASSFTPAMPISVDPAPVTTAHVHHPDSWSGAACALLYGERSIHSTLSHDSTPVSARLRRPATASKLTRGSRTSRSEHSADATQNMDSNMRQGHPPPPPPHASSNQIDVIPLDYSSTLFDGFISRKQEALRMRLDLMSTSTLGHGSLTSRSHPNPFVKSRPVSAVSC